MKRRMSQTELDAVKAEYDRWDKFGSDSETSDELARRLGISKATLYRWRDRGWSIDGPARAIAATNGDGDTTAVVQWLMSELIAARVRIAELERLIEGRNGDSA